MRYKDILGHTSEAILNANKFTMPWQRQNICQVEILVFVRRHSVITSTISLQNKAKNILRMRFKQYNYNTIQLQHNTLQHLCTIIRKIAIRGLSIKIHIYTKNLASEVGRTLSDHENRHNRHRLFCNFPRLLRAIECKMAILLVYLSLLYVEKKQR
jgi:hypothetical protein